MNAEPPVTIVHLRDPDETIRIARDEEYVAFDMSEPRYFTFIGKVLEADDHTVVRDLFSVPIARLVYVHTERARIARPQETPPKIDQEAREERRRRYES